MFGIRSMEQWFVLACVFAAADCTTERPATDAATDVTPHPSVDGGDATSDCIHCVDATTTHDAQRESGTDSNSHPNDACVATTCEAQHKNCGNISNNCGETLNCGDCPASSTCGGGGTLNVCGVSSSGDAGWRLTFSDEFNGSSVDTSLWTTHYTDEPGGRYTNNDELEWYVNDAVSESGGRLALEANRRQTSGSSCNGSVCPFTSGMITNLDSFTQTYGYFEMRAQVPHGKGFWPAFWLVPTDNSWPPEIDVMEMLDDNTNLAYMTLHWGTENSQQGGTFTGPDFSAGLHVFAVDWEIGVVTWYIDGAQVYQIQNANVSSIPMSVIANLAVGGSWPGSPDSTTPFPSTMAIDYIRCWQMGGPYLAIPGPSDPIPNRSGP